jgi:hypothetical protein
VGMGAYSSLGILYVKYFTNCTCLGTPIIPSPTIPLLPTFYTFLIIDINTFDSAPKLRLLEQDLANEMVRLDIGSSGKSRKNLSSLADLLP